MTVAELIERLSKIEDKTVPVFVHDDQYGEDRDIELIRDVSHAARIHLF